MTKQITLTEQMRKNPWILSTLVLGIFVLILIAGSFFSAKVEIEKLTSKEALCKKVEGTPSWFDWRGDLVDSGYMPITIDNRNNSRGVVDMLIMSKIYFVYSSQCSWCLKQIEWFGEEQWKQYQDSGFTIDCLDEK